MKSSKIEGYRLKLEDDCRSICINSRKSDHEVRKKKLTMVEQGIRTGLTVRVRGVHWSSPSEVLGVELEC